MNNRYPHYICGSCAVNLAYQSSDISAETVLNNCCSNCELYQKGIQQITAMLYSYKNIFIEAKYTPDTFDHYSYRIVNRKEWYDDIILCCDAIDKEIANV